MPNPFLGMSRSTLIACTACCCVLLAQTSGVAAQTAAPRPSGAVRETARKIVEEGDQFRAAGNLREALSRYQAAYALAPVPPLGLDVAQVQAQLGQLVEARATAIEVIYLPESDKERAVSIEARKTATELASQLDKQIPGIQAEISPAEAKFGWSVDGVALPEEAVREVFRANPGPHTVHIAAPGYHAEDRHVVLKEGAIHKLSVVLKPAPEEQAAETLVPPPAANNVVAQPALDPKTAAATTGQQVATHHDDIASRISAGRVRGYTALGVGGAVFALGAVTGIMSITKTSSAKDHCHDGKCDASQRDTLSSANTLANIANISLPLGAIGIGYGLYELLTLPSAERAHARTNGLQLTLQGTYMTVRGSL